MFLVQRARLTNNTKPIPVSHRESKVYIYGTAHYKHRLDLKPHYTDI